MKKRIKRLLEDQVKAESNLPSVSMAKLPKIEVPTFDESLLNWQSFWDQFRVAVHNKTRLTDVDKLAYLTYALKDSQTKHAIEGLTLAADNYAEGID